MTGYYMLECMVPLGQTAYALSGYPSIDGVESWTLGSRFAREPKHPIVVRWAPDTQGLKKSFYDATVPLMRRELVEALRVAGVDNLDCYDALIEEPETGDLDTGYLAVNVVGTIGAADLTKSAWADLSGRRRIDMDFDSLTIKPLAPRGALLFRLAECTSGLVIHARVKAQLETSGGFGLSFVDPGDWIG